MNKIRYTVRRFDIETMTSHLRDVYDIFPDGKVEYYLYEKGVRTPLKKETTNKATPTDYEEFYEKLKECINSADRTVQYVDDCDADVVITNGCQKEKYNRGYGNDDETVGDIIAHYLFGKAALEW